MDEQINRSSPMTRQMSAHTETKNSPNKPQPKTVWTASELMETEFPPVNWVISQMAPEGLLILAGAPKLGKSWMAMGLSVNKTTGGLALGKIKCIPGDVLHLALEDNPRRLKNRLQMMDLNVNNRLQLRTQFPAIGDSSFFPLLDEWRSHVKCPSMIVIDTMERIRPESAGKNKQTAYGADTKFLAPLQAYALEHHLLIIIVHHIKKDADPDWVKQISGSLGLSGVADTIWMLERERGENTAILKGTGRDIDEFEKTVSVDWSRGLWALTDDVAGEASTPERQQILDYLREVGVAKTGEIAKAIYKSSQNTSNLLTGLESDGRIYKPKYGHWDLIDKRSEATQCK